MRPTWRAATLLLVPPLLLACGPDEGPGGQPGGGATVEERVGELPGVADVSVAEDVVEEDGPAVTEITVTLADDPAVDEVAAVLTELTDPGTDDGNALTATYVGGDGSYRTGPQAGVSAVRDVDATDDVDEAAELFVAGLALADSLGGEAATDVDHDPEVDNDDSGLSVTVVPASDSPADVDAAVEAVADDPVLSGAGALVVGQDFG